MKVRIRIISELGEFKGDVLEMTKPELDGLTEASKDYYKSGFEMVTEDGGHVVIPPQVISNSILKIDVM